jgi:ribosomal-protein-serine acetyltransferase
MQGRGIVTRACRGLITYAFTQLELNRVEIHSVTANVRSRAVAKRLGFTQEGIRRQDQRLHGRFVDIAIYGLLASEWKS